MDRKIKLCVFDLDGTTADTLPSIIYHLNGVLTSHGYPEVPPETHKSLPGGGARSLFVKVSAMKGYGGIDIDGMTAEWISRYSADPVYLTSPFDGIAAMLRELREAGIRTAVLTNKNEVLARSVVAALYGDLIEKTVGDAPGRALKPDPGELLALCSEFGADPSECIHSGDHMIDIRTAKAAGTFSCGVSWGFNPPEALSAEGASFIAEKPADISAAALGGTVYR
ncbi:MAG: HAD family hydrolase [Clostridia bacterium]|nr:HAD family hydrolase [Clostridia bacterium]